MAKGKWIDKKTATHFTLVHRPQNDPLIHDESAPQMVLNPTQTKGTKSKALDDLASELGSEVESIRDNEGEAANYGVYFDDTEYDYMQHLRDLNSGGPGEVVFVEANSSGNKNKGKNKMSLEDALRQMDLENKADDLLDEVVLPSKNLQHVSYQAQQNIPDAIAGFQPDMDPRLREVLEALEDEEFVDNEDDDIFQELAKDGREIDEYEFEETEFNQEYPNRDDDDDDGWESDHTAKPTREYKGEEADQVPELVSLGANGAQGQNWMEDFKKFKQDQKTGKPTGVITGSVLESTWTTTTNGGRRKKRKGALTNASSYSMTSSSLVRTEQLTILDARYEKLEQRYQSDLDDLGSVSEISTASSVQGPLRSDFDNVMDDFLAGYSKGRRPSKKSKGGQSGLDQLDEIRKGLGPARIPGRR